MNSVHVKTKKLHTSTVKKQYPRLLPVTMPGAGPEFFPWTKSHVVPGESHSRHNLWGAIIQERKAVNVLNPVKLPPESALTCPS